MTSFFDIKDLSKKDLERIIDDSIDIKKNGCDKILNNKKRRLLPPFQSKYII